MASHNGKAGGGRLPPLHVPDPNKPDEVYAVDHVTDANRAELHKSSKETKVALYSADLSNLLHTVYIPRTREFPDCVKYQGELYVFNDTTKTPPRYAKAMVAVGSYFPQTEKE